jgi:hypothetical protein
MYNILLYIYSVARHRATVSGGKFGCATERGGREAEGGGGGQVSRSGRGEAGPFYVHGSSFGEVIT